MDDNDDAHSELAPEGWASIFNRVNPSRALPSTTSSAKLKVKPQAETTGWFAGLLGGGAATRRSSISSDTIPDQEAKNGSDADEDPAMLKLNLGDDEESGEESQNDSNVDSDGFPTGANRSKHAPSSAAGSISNSVVGSYTEDATGNIIGEEKPVVLQPALRRERQQKRLNFTVTQSASAAAVADEEVKTPISPGVPPVEKPAPVGTVDNTTAPEPVSWWQSLLPVSNASSEPKQPTDPGPSTQKVNELIQEPQVTKSDGVWSSMFGASGISEAETRKLLPIISGPPVIDALAEANSYYAPRPMGPSLEIFGPRPLRRFSGRVRGWPRRFAPHWSSDGQPDISNKNQNIQKTFPSTAGINGAAALAMFRVT
jgi:hypothetical protein